MTCELHHQVHLRHSPHVDVTSRLFASSTPAKQRGHGCRPGEPPALCRGRRAGLGRSGGGGGDVIRRNFLKDRCFYSALAPAARAAESAAALFDPSGEMHTGVQLNFVNQSNDANNSQIVIFQKNVASDFELAVAWRVIKYFRPGRQPRCLPAGPAGRCQRQL